MTGWAETPGKSCAAYAEGIGRGEFVRRCVALLSGGEVDAQTLTALAGPAATVVLAGGAGGLDGYWPRVWGARGLLYVWEDGADDAIVAATRDEAWRVREMAAKVVARHRRRAATQAVAALGGDSVARVRRAGERALVRLFEWEPSVDG